ncbi:TPA: hypothetical protein N0F65_000826 [Lagenidium giganteum]|uniref:Uncharacterized protein n=1 Tax=Lagenidium giganteum TaxID=4803 RepID=A0AAV2YZD8_9STRA|nr:TPA: hypothetical protein N0F65_000826 [Lagenidium giganteum]
MLRMQQLTRLSALSRTSVVTARSLVQRRCPSGPSCRWTSTSSHAKRDGFLKDAWAQYSIWLETKPLTTKIVTGSVIAAVGDVNCQLFLEGDKPFDYKRAAIFTFLGGVLVSPILHVWYGFLGTTVPGVTGLALGKRLVLDQLVFAPTFLPVFFSSLLALEGTPDKIPEKLADDWWPAVKTNWAVWVPAQLINFRFVTGSLQVLFANVVGLFWNSYLSYVSHADHHVEHDDKLAIKASA